MARARNSNVTVARQGREPAVRYQEERLAKASVPGGELLVAGAHGRHLEICHGTVSDENPVFRGQRQRVAINVKTDVLEYEAARGRISEAGYNAAQKFRRILERSRTPITGLGQWAPRDKVDLTVSHETSILQNLANASDAARALDDARQACGPDGLKILELALLTNKTIEDCAEQLSSSRVRTAVSFWAETFRRSCENLADFWGVSGKPTGKIVSDCQST